MRENFLRFYQTIQIESTGNNYFIIIAFPEYSE
jgi:hypothetical protein